MINLVPIVAFAIAAILVNFDSTRNISLTLTNVGLMWFVIGIYSKLN